ncbi:MAG: outer membrane lipoprotein carrier protein LolA [Bryobacteraceae bacterium]
MSLLRLLVGVVAVSALSADASLDALLNRVENRYNRAKTLQVLFSQRYLRPGVGQKIESGTLDLRKPGRMRWDYRKPAGKLAVSDGKFLYLYDPEQNQARRWKMQDTEDLRAPLAFLLGKLHFQKEFKNIQGRPDGAGTRITAEPQNDNLPYSAVEFVVTPEGRIEEVKVTSFDRSVQDYTFADEKMDPPLSDRLFQFQLPPGAQLTEGGQ